MIGIANTSYKLSRVGGHHFIAVLHPDCALRLEGKLLPLGSQVRRSAGSGLAPQRLFSG
jgi:hypothetical protein